MRKLIILIIFFIIIFVINIIFYSLSEDYRFFLKKIKDRDEIVYLDEKNYDDNLEKEILKEAKLIKTSDKNEKIFEIKKDSWVIILKSDITLWKNYMDIINLFSIYKLAKLELNSNLFDLTDEYPDNYFEYYSRDLTLYIFPTKRYEDLYDIFSVLSDELPFSINEVNNFLDNSFYINLNSDIEDRFIRTIIWYKWIVFWLKIKKTEYNLVKEKLNSLNIEEKLLDIIENEEIQN